MGLSALKSLFTMLGECRDKRALGLLSKEIRNFIKNTCQPFCDEIGHETRLIDISFDQLKAACNVALELDISTLVGTPFELIKKEMSQDVLFASRAPVVGAASSSRATASSSSSAAVSSSSSAAVSSSMAISSSAAAPSY